MPATIDISAPGDRKGIPGVRIHHPRALEGTWHRGFPLTTPARTLLDISPTLPFQQLRKAVAEAEYRRLVDLTDLATHLGRGKPGSTRLRAAIHAHLPQLARTLSRLEDAFVLLCESHHIPLPEVNANVCGFKVDCLWRAVRLIVELDGGQAHGRPSAVRIDRDRELTLRAAGYRLRRYSHHQITHQQDRVIADLRAALRPIA